MSGAQRRHGHVTDGVGLDARKGAILTAVVREFVHSAEPIGSKRLVDRYELGVSAATVRNEMAALEEDGYITQPHTSAGRVPTDKGYRYFVDSIDEVRPLGEAHRLALRGFLDQARDFEDLLRRTTRLLARLTRYASVALAPALDRSRLKLVELVGLAPRTVLLLLIADTGRVEKRLVELREPIAPMQVERVRTVLHESVTGLRMADVPAAVAGLAEGAPADLRWVLDALADTTSDDLGTPTTDRLFVGGQAELAGASGLGTGELHRLLKLLEDQATLERLLAESGATASRHSRGGDRPIVRIGQENQPIEELRGASIVAAGYGTGAPGSLGVLGPTRMDYPTVLAAVQAVADHLHSSLRTMIDPTAEDTGPGADHGRDGDLDTGLDTGTAWEDSTV